MTAHCELRITDYPMAACGLRTADSARARERADRPYRSHRPHRSYRSCSPILLLALCLALFSGCGRQQAAPPGPAQRGPGNGAAVNPPSESRDHIPPGSDRGPQSATGFAPAKISVLPLTELSVPAGTGPGATLTVYVALLDAFGVQIKAPGVLRFELYDHVPRSSEPKGQRIAIWPDIDLTRPADNHKCWRDFLRAYEFNFDLQADGTKTCILEVTCISTDGRRLSAEYTLKGAQP